MGVRATQQRREGKWNRGECFGFRFWDLKLRLKCAFFAYVLGDHGSGHALSQVRAKLGFKSLELLLGKKHCSENMRVSEEGCWGLSGQSEGFKF